MLFSVLVQSQYSDALGSIWLRVLQVADARYNRVMWEDALGSTRLRVLQVRYIINFSLSNQDALGSIRLRVLQDGTPINTMSTPERDALGSTRLRVLQGPGRAGVRIFEGDDATWTLQYPQPGRTQRISLR